METAGAPLVTDVEEEVELTSLSGTVKIKIIIEIIAIIYTFDHLKNLSVHDLIRQNFYFILFIFI